MTLPTCPREADVVRAAMSGGWPAQADPALVEHAGHCAVCREAVLVSTLLQDAERDTEAPVPTAAQVWWRLAVRARLERERAAARPVIWLQGLAAACGLGLVVAGASFVRPWIAAAGGDVTSRAVRLLPDASWTAALATTPGLVALSAAGLLTVTAASAALYLWLADD